MKKVMVCLLALTFAISLTAFAQYSGTSQDNNATQTQADQMSAKAPLMTLKGTVKADGDKYTFVSDKDGKSWDVMNPEELKGHEGHHVQLSAHVYGDKNSTQRKLRERWKGRATGADGGKLTPVVRHAARAAERSAAAAQRSGARAAALPPAARPGIQVEAKGGGGKSGLRRAVCRITSGTAALKRLDGQCNRKYTASERTARRKSDRANRRR